ncbi:MaoC family dehydratase [Flavobacterium sedimenticola]|uniref:MaoC family dehydratase n=1 Tax=Flavobacterium sedimenticola TaxID=3043286 RepID=A0ABT6XRI9_9FLAO|nr:MaoC family dehydratase [Flavobacterium sedimenticola]MDI9257710.1 MaoC family dehydratase [Flavobacterium sedimenticola]
MDNRITVGSSYEYEFSFNQEDVIKFAHASGDFNPIHLDEEYAKDSMFKRTIIHGFLGGSVFSKVFGTIFPGNGTIYLKQDLSFYKPMFTQKQYKATFEVTETDTTKNRAVVRTAILDDNNEIVIKGEALIKHPSIY